MDQYSLTAAMIKATIPTPSPSYDMTQEQKDLYNSLTVKSAYQRCLAMKGKSLDERHQLIYEWVKSRVITYKEYRQLIELVEKAESDKNTLSGTNP